MEANPLTEQERFWAGEFGTAYAERNEGEGWVAANTALFAKILARTGRLDGVVEFGASIGLNLMALQRLQPGLICTGIEINADAHRKLGKLPGVKAIHGSLLGAETVPQADLALIKGVLIHQAPDSLPMVYDLLARTARRFVVIAEYYSPSPVEIPYRGHSGKLFKRDFAGEFLDRNPTWKVIDYGFVWRRDPLFPQDDLNWFLLARN